MEKNLEEIFWKEEKFVDSKGREVKPEAVGKPIIITHKRLDNKNFEDYIYKEYQNFTENKNIKGYLVGENYGIERFRKVIMEYSAPVQFYKI